MVIILQILIGSNDVQFYVSTLNNIRCQVCLAFIRLISDLYFVSGSLSTMSHQKQLTIRACCVLVTQWCWTLLRPHGLCEVH